MTDDCPGELIFRVILWNVDERDSDETVPSFGIVFLAFPARKTTVDPYCYLSDTLELFMKAHSST